MPTRILVASGGMYADAGQSPGSLTGRFRRSGRRGAGQFAVSSNGTLAWVQGSPQAFPDSKLVTIDWRGQVSPLPVPARAYGPMLRISPDGRRLAVCIKTLTETGLWLHDLTRGTLIPRNREGQSDWPVWSPDGQQLALQWVRDGRPALAILSVDGTSAPQPVASYRMFPSSWTPDRQQLVTVLIQDSGDLAAVTMDGETASVRLLTQTGHHEFWPELSPDGRWLAYSSNASGRFEVFVRPYPEPGPSEPVSIQGGTNPIWNPNGKELFFVTWDDEANQRRMMAVDFMPGSPPRIGHPRLRFVFKLGDFAICRPVRCHDIAPDGQRFYGVQTSTPTPPPVVTQINLIQNWVEELKARVPTTR